MQLPESVKRGALRNRFVGALNSGDCDAAASVLNEARQSPLYDPLRFVDSEAIALATCDFEEARAVALLAKYVAMHPDNERYAGVLAGIQDRRPENRYREQSIQIGRDAITAGAGSGVVSPNLVVTLADAGRIDEAREIYDTFRRAQGANAASKSTQRLSALFEAWIHFNNKEYAKADEIIRRETATIPLREDAEFFWLGA